MVREIIEKYRNKSGDRDPTKKFVFNAKNLSPSLTCAEAGITKKSNIFVVTTKSVRGAGGSPFLDSFMDIINILFIKKSKESYKNNFNCELHGVLKLSLLKEISSKLSIDDLRKLPELITYIIRILKNGYIETDEDIKKKLKKF